LKRNDFKIFNNKEKDKKFPRNKPKKRIVDNYKRKSNSSLKKPDEEKRKQES
jgi:hypothetical protein